MSCEFETQTKKTPIDDLIGIWELDGREMFNGIHIEISKDTDNDITGRIIKLNDNKYVKMFVEQNDIWIIEITRISNSKFKLIEKKIGSALFEIYDQKATQIYIIQFIDKNTIALSDENSEPKLSTIQYKRIISN